MDSRSDLRRRRVSPSQGLTVALAGNPNVGKSTVFNGLTGLHQHTGNWTGKTVVSAQGTYSYRGREYTVVDTPGAYSLRAASGEEEAARDYIVFGGADVTVVVCDASCLERNLNLLLQIMEVTPRVLVAVNLMDQAQSRGIEVDVPALSRALGVPAVAMSARRGRGFRELKDAVASYSTPPSPRLPRYSDALEAAIESVERALPRDLMGSVPSRWAALRLLEGDAEAVSAVNRRIGRELVLEPGVAGAISSARARLAASGVTALREEVIASIYRRAEAVAAECVRGGREYDLRQLRLDRALTRRAMGIPVMLLLLSLIFFITIKGADYPSGVLMRCSEWVGDELDSALTALGASDPIREALVLGIWRVLGWVISVMLPPMAIFFPLFTLLEDLGYLPRVAFDLDSGFRKAGACGKQCLTMAMGFGCNAAGVVGCRIIDSPRERLIAQLTNSLVPCNGRFPMLITLITLFFVGSGGPWGTAEAACVLTLLIALSVLVTLAASKFLSSTLLRGKPSALTLELPPFRPPNVPEVLTRSLLDRTLFVLGRAAAVAAPAGLIIYLAANVHLAGGTVLSHIVGALDPLGRALGMDGVILAAFILGLPANETVIPIMVMAYAASGTLAECDLASLRSILAANGWGIGRAVCVTLFALFHWPCATTVLTIRRETGSLKWTLAALVLPTAVGAALSFLAARIFEIFGI